jgi:5'-nucleotidase
MAISLDAHDRGNSADFGAAGSVGAWLAERVLQHGLPADTFLNVNLPERALAEIHGIRVTRLGRRVYRDMLVAREDPRGRPYYWLGGESPSGELDEGTDLWAVANGYVSVTPVQMDMTAYSLLDTVRGWGLEKEGVEPWTFGQP